MNNRVCKRCSTKVERESQVKDYLYYCPNCDENLYEFETETEIG